MAYKIIQCDSVIKKITRKDALFHGNYCIDPYQNCELGCLYCDSSSEKTVYIKANVVEILQKELQHIQKGMMIIGSVHEPYQNAEKTYELTKNILVTLQQHRLPCHILTKSPLILRDIDLLSDLHCKVTVSLTSLDDRVVHIFEPDAPSPTARLNIVQTLRERGIETGVALIPVLPFIVESELEDIVKAAHQADAQYLLHKHLELKGDQETLFKKIIETHYPQLLPQYNELYKDNFNPRKKYIQEINSSLHKYCKKYNVSEKIVV